MASGDRANTSRKPKGGGKEKPDKKPQSERFKETARALEADESGNLFERMFRKVVPPRKNSKADI